MFSFTITSCHLKALLKLSSLFCFFSSAIIIFRNKFLWKGYLGASGYCHPLFFYVH